MIRIKAPLLESIHQTSNALIPSFRRGKGNKISTVHLDSSRFSDSQCSDDDLFISSFLKSLPYYLTNDNPNQTLNTHARTHTHINTNILSETYCILLTFLFLFLLQSVIFWKQPRAHTHTHTYIFTHTHTNTAHLSLKELLLFFCFYSNLKTNKHLNTN